MPTLQATRHHHWSYLTRGLHHTTTTPQHHQVSITLFSPQSWIYVQDLALKLKHVFFNKRYQVCRPVLVLVLVFVTWTCARDVIAEEIFVTSILQPQSWIQINWTWLCVLHIRSLLDSRWIDTYFILGDKKIAVDLNSIRCSLEISKAEPGQPA